MLHAKYECTCHYGLSHEDLLRFSPMIPSKIVCAQAEPKYDPKGITLTLTYKGSRDDAMCKI